MHHTQGEVIVTGCEVDVSLYGEVTVGRGGGSSFFQSSYWDAGITVTQSGEIRKNWITVGKKKKIFSFFATPVLFRHKTTFYIWTANI